MLSTSGLRLAPVPRAARKERVAQRTATRPTRASVDHIAVTPAIRLVGGRPPVLDFAAAVEEILSRHINGELILHILPAHGRPKHLPSRGYFYKRVVADDPPGLADSYARARGIWIHMRAEEMLDIADDTSRDTVIEMRSDGTVVRRANKEWIARSRLRIHVRMRIFDKIIPPKSPASARSPFVTF